MKATIFFILVVVVGLCEARKPKKTQKQGEGLWKKKQAAVQARTDFNKLWQSTLGKETILCFRGFLNGAVFLGFLTELVF